MGLVSHLILYLIPAIVAALIVAYTWQRRYYRSSRPFAMLMGAIAFWCTCHSLSIADPTFEGTLFWSLMQYAGIVTIMPSWLLFSLSYAGQWWRRKRSLLLALFLPPLIFFILVLTNDQHHLWWPTVVADTSRGFMWLKVTRGLFFWIHSAYAYVCFTAGVFFLVYGALRAAPKDRLPAWLMIIAAAIPAFGNVAYLLGWQPPWNDDPTPIFLFIGGVIAFYATIHFRVIDLAPLVEREVFAALPDGLIVLDGENTVIDANDLAPQLLAVEPRRWIGRPLLQVIAASPYYDALSTILARGYGPRTYQATTGSGDHVRTIELHARPLLAGNGAPAGTLLLLRDTSERARVEQARARHLAELSLINQVARVANTASETELLIRASAAAIVETGQWERVAVCMAEPFANQVAFVADYSHEAGTGFEGQLVNGEEGTELYTMLRSGNIRLLQIDDDSTDSSIVRAMRSEGLQSMLTVPLYHQGEPLGLLLLGNTSSQPNTSDLLNLAETIGELITDAVVRTRLYEEVRTADQLKASFLATVSHELRTPLTSIIGYIEMIQRGIYGPLDERMVEALTYMRIASVNLQRLINDILEFSRMEAGHLKIDLQPVDALRTIYNVIGQLQPQIRDNKLELEIDLPRKLPLVQANAARLEQVLTNLLSNAIKFTDAGTITIAAKQVGDRLRISVSDTGIGIAGEHLEAIFQDFRRVEHNGRRSSGAGLGLAISRRLIALMGGTIEVESAVGAGSTFSVELPLTDIDDRGRGSTIVSQVQPISTPRTAAGQLV